MNPNREEALFALALTKPAAERGAWLDRECGEDKALRQRLEALLAAHEQPETLLATQAEAARPTIKLHLADEPADDAVGQTIGRYKLLEKIGEGGCGVVYVAEQTAPVRRRVALKVIKLGMDTKAVVARFEAERQALAMMDHPNIAKVLDAGTTDVGRPYFVMELVRGIRITDYCDQANLSTKNRLDLFIQVCHAIQHAHQKGIIHRDIKPSNILVTLHDGVPVPKVIDFGIAKATEGRLTDATVYTQLHQFIGTPAYMSPEQAEMSGLDIDTRSDIYSLGVLLYELLTGSTPFDPKELLSQGLEAMRKTIREKEPVRPSTRLATLGADQLTTTAKRRSAEAPKLIHQLKGDLDWIVMKCLEKDRARRYETANGLAADLKRFLNNEPVVARPPSAAYRFRKMLTRHKAVSVAITAVVFGLVFGIGFSTYAFLRERQAFRALEVSERQAAIERVRFAIVSGDEQGVGQALRDAAAKGVPGLDLRLLRGQFLVISGRHSEAVAELQPLLDADPDRVAVLGLYASAHLEEVSWTGYELLLPKLRTARPVSPDDHLFLGQALAFTEPHVGIPLIEKAVAMQNSPVARVILANARIFQAMDTGQPNVMEEALREVAAAETWSRNSLAVLVAACRAHTLAALLYDRLGQTERASAERRAADTAGRRLEAFYPSVLALVARLEQLDEGGAGEEARKKALQWATDIPELRAPCVLMLWQGGDSRAAFDAFQQWSETLAPHDIGWFLGYLSALDLPEARREMAIFRDNTLNEQSPSLSLLYNSYTTLVLQGALSEAQAFARAFRSANREKLAALGPHYERVLQFACGDLADEDFLRQSRDSQFFLSEAHYWVGLNHLAADERSQAAAQFAASIETGCIPYWTRHLSKGILHRMRTDPTWPPTLSSNPANR